MARSKIKGTNGKPRKKGTNRSKLMASVTYSDSDVRGVMTRTKVNDGDASTYHASHSGTYRAGPGPARPNLIRRSTQDKVTEVEGQSEVSKAYAKRKKKK